MLPKLSFRTTTGGLVSTHDFGNVDAGSFSPDSSGWEVRLYNDYDGDGRDAATSVKINVRGSSGGTDEVWCEQHWVEAKSNGCSTGITDDAMTVFQPIGTNSPMGVGDISSEEYRTLKIRVNAPNSAEEQNVSLQLIAVYQNPQSAISKWITGTRGNGVVATTGSPFATSTGGSTDGTIPYSGGTALIDNNEIYYGSSGSHTITSTGDGVTYTLYLNESGTFGETSGSLASNEMALAKFTFTSDGFCNSITDMRNYISEIKAGTTNAIPELPVPLGSLYFDLVNGKLLGAQTSTGWIQL